MAEGRAYPHRGVLLSLAEVGLIPKRVWLAGTCHRGRRWGSVPHGLGIAALACLSLALGLTSLSPTLAAELEFVEITVIVVVVMVMVVVITCLLSHYKLSARSFIGRHSQARRRDDALSSVSTCPPCLCWRSLCWGREGPWFSHSVVLESTGPGR